MAMGDVRPAPILPTTIYILFSILFILISYGVISLAKTSQVKEQVKDGEGYPMILFNQMIFHFRKVFGFMDPKIFEYAYNLQHIKSNLEILLSS